MNERLIIQFSEIILTIAAVSSIIIILAATIQDFRRIARRKHLQLTGTSKTAVPSELQTNPALHALPSQFIILSRRMIDKALSWHPNHHRELLITILQNPRLAATLVTNSSAPTHPSDALRLIRVIVISLGLVLLIGLVTYFFYTVATLKSSTLLTLSWATVCLWLFAAIWSDDSLTLSKKYELTFTVPFMYFLFYVQLFIQLGRNVRSLISNMTVPSINFTNFHDSLMKEVYSTRF